MAITAINPLCYIIGLSYIHGIPVSIQQRINTPYIIKNPSYFIFIMRKEVLYVSYHIHRLILVVCLDHRCVIAFAIILPVARSRHAQSICQFSNSSSLGSGFPSLCIANGYERHLGPICQLSLGQTRSVPLST